MEMSHETGQTFRCTSGFDFITFLSIFKLFGNVTLFIAVQQYERVIYIILVLIEL